MSGTVEQLLEKWLPSGGNERANTQLFVAYLCSLLNTAPPQPTLNDTTRNDYVFERHVIKTGIDGISSNGWVDCYKRNSFILEAKQGSAADIAAVEIGQGESLRDFFGQMAAERFKQGMARRGTTQWTGATQRAAIQAERYAKALPADHGWPPFLLATDVGYCIDVMTISRVVGRATPGFQIVVDTVSRLKTSKTRRFASGYRPFGRIS